jgi:hypothetical protein
MDQVWTFERVAAFGHWLSTQQALPPAASRQLGQIIYFLAQQCDDQARALAEVQAALAALLEAARD